MGKFKLYKVLEYVFPKSCYRIELDVHRMYARLGIKFVAVGNPTPFKIQNLDPNKPLPQFRIEASIVEPMWRDELKDYSKLYTSKQMRKKF